MIFYIAIYKCVQRRKYINGFSQWGSMHELFFKDGRGWGTLVVNARFPNRIKPYRFMLNICAVCVWVFLVCLFVLFCFVPLSPGNHVPRKHHLHEFQKTLANAAC